MVSHLVILYTYLNDWVVWRRLHPRAVRLLHVPPVRRELGQERGGGHDAEKSAQRNVHVHEIVVST